jgi:hypothetical protein
MDLDQHLKALDRRAIPSDLERILDIPRMAPQSGPDAAARWTDKLGRGGASLRDIQGHALEVISVFNGAFCMVGVGHGKTLIALLAGMAAGASSPVVIVPPSLVKQMESEAEKWVKFFKFPPPKIISYGVLSTQTDLLQRLKPDLIIADEAHYLRHKTSARTRRFIRYFHENPRCGFVALSGTITAKSLLDYSHLLELALRERAPIPLNRWELERWAACVDPDGEPNQSDLNRLGYLVRWSSQSKLAPTNPATIRAAFRERLTTTPGVISTREGSCDASLYLNKHTPEHTPVIRAALKKLRDEWATPDGEPIADASTKSRTFKNLAMGFYYVWNWGPTGPDMEWLDTRRELNRLVSKVLRYSPREGRDSPALVMEWSRAGGGSVELRNVVNLWDEIRHRADPLTVPVWICSSKIQFLFEYVFEFSEPVIVWYSSAAVGASLASLGLTVHGAGSLSPTGRTCAASIAVHGKGRNLQMYSRCFIAEAPSNGATFEQLLGRTHRAGQASDEVWWDFFDFGTAVKKAKSHAEYIEDTHGTAQKLNLATFLTTGKSPQKRKEKK